MLCIDDDDDDDDGGEFKTNNIFLFQLGEVSPTIINAAKNNYLPTESSGEKQQLPETWM
jgi:hypothetical protein